MTKNIKAMEAVNPTSETSVNIYKATWRYIPVDSHLHMSL
jgi:hypothetical protein